MDLDTRNEINIQIYKENYSDSAITKKFFPLKLVHWIVLCIFVVISLLASGYFYFNSQYLRNRPAPISEAVQEKLKEKERCRTLTYDSQKRFEFIDEVNISDQKEKDAIHFLLGDTEYLTERFSIADRIEDMVYSPKLNQVVYLTGYDVFENKNHMREVRVIDLVSESTSIIFEYRTQLHNAEGMVLDLDDLRSISLSPDQTKLMVITDKELFRYDLLAKEFDFSYKPIDVQVPYQEENRHFFNYAQISPSNRYAVLSYGYYEGISYYLLDFNSKTISSLDKEGYGGGTFVKGWYNEKILYYDSTGEAKVCVENVDRSEKECFTTTNIWPREIKSVYGKVYVLTNRQDVSVSHEGCNNVENIFRFNTDFDSLFEVSLSDLTPKEILHVDSTEVSGFLINTAIMQFAEYELNGKKGLVLQLLDENKQPLIAFLNPLVPEKLTILNLSN